MSEFKELIQSFAKSREYVRDFFVYGFKTREEFTKKSSRTYDNERRRIESWLSGFIQKDYTAKGKNISLAIDSNLLDTNPLYRVWKTKSFTDNDILLHFYLLDYLDETTGETIEEITDGILEKYQILLEPQMVRRKCNEYEKQGLLWKKKQGRELLYGKGENFYYMLQKCPELLDAIKLEHLISPFGVVGSTILDTLSQTNQLFRVKHSFFVHTLEDEILLELTCSMREEKSVELLIQSTRSEHKETILGVPLQIFTSTRTGRRFLCLYYIERKRFFCARMDSIKKVTLLEVYPEYQKLRNHLNQNREKSWGVSFQSMKNSRMHTIKMILHIDEAAEGFVLQRLNREKKGGIIKKIAPDTFSYENTLFDVNEMVPWIRTFTGRIVSLESNHPSLTQTFHQDMNALFSMYEINQPEDNT